MTEDKGPRVVGTTRAVVLTGALIPWRKTSMCLMRIGESPYLYIPCFSSKRQLQSTMVQADIQFDNIKKIDDEREFLRSIFCAPNWEKYRVIMDPRFRPDGRLTFAQLKYDTLAHRLN